jgi:hypothetical protein
MDISTQRAIHRDVWAQLWERGVVPLRLSAASTYCVEVLTLDGKFTAYFTRIEGKYKVTDVVSAQTESECE